MPRPRIWPSSWVWLIAGLVAMVVGTAGCAGVPTSGPVHVGRSVTDDTASGSNSVRQIPASPSLGLTQTGVVNGFLSALIDSDDNFKIARQFLAPGTPWNSATGTTVYAPTSLVVTRIHSAIVTAQVRRTAVIDPQGHYRIDPAKITAAFSLAQQGDHQWRITGLPPGVMLSSTDVDRSLQPASVYFLNHSEQRVVPDPILVPRDAPGLATTLVQQLLAGPSHDLAPGVQTAAPPGTVLVGTVPIDGNGIAEVNLAGGVQKISASAVGRLAAQIDWTLAQVPTITAVRLLSNGAPLTAAGVAATQPVASWPQFDPDAPPTSRGVLLVNRSRVIGVSATVPASLAHRLVTSPVVSADGGQAAALSASGSGSRVLVGTSQGPPHSIVLPAPLASPSFDPSGDLFLISGLGAAARLIEISSTFRLHQVDVPSAITERGLDAVSISRDGSRIALVVGPPRRSELLVGGLGLSHGIATVNGMWVAVPAVRSVRAVGWAGANDIVTTVARPDGHREVLETGVDGYESQLLSDSGLPGSVTQVAASPDQPTVATVGDAVYALTGLHWQRLGPGVDPSYAG